MPKGLASRADSQSNIRGRRLRGSLVAVPPVEDQDRVIEQLSAADARLAVEERRQPALASLFLSVLHHLITGKVW